MAKNIPAGQAVFKFVFDDQVSTKLGRLGQKLKGIGNAFKPIMTIVSAVGAGIAAAVTGIVALGNKFATFGDRFGKMSTRLDIGAEQLQELSFVANRTGTSIDSLGQAMFRARRRLGNFQLGQGGPAARAIKELRLDVARLNRLNPEDMFLELVDALSKVRNEAERNQLAFEIFGDNFRDIQPLIDAGTKSIKQMRLESRRLGLIVSEQDIRNAEKLRDAIDTVREQITVLQVKTGALFGNTLTTIFQSFQIILARVIHSIDDLNRRIDKMFGNIGKKFQKFFKDIGLSDAEIKRGGFFTGEGQRPEDYARVPAFASTGFTSGFAAAMASSFKTPDNPMVKQQERTNDLLEQMRDNVLKFEP